MAGTPIKMVEYLLETRIDKTCSFDGKTETVELSTSTFIVQSRNLQLRMLTSTGGNSRPEGG